LVLVIDPVSHEIIDNNLTSSHTHDSYAFLKMVPKLPSTINTLWGDGAYDSTAVYEALYKQNIRPVIPPQRGAVLTEKNYRKQPHLGRRSLVQKAPALAPRDTAVEYINLFPDKEEGRRRWKQHSSYHLRSLAETGMMRFKQTFSDKLKARTLPNQQAEARVKCSILNKMIQIAAANSMFPEFLT
jgi:hypothetical protein